MPRIASIAYDIDLEVLDRFAAGYPLEAANRTGDTWPAEQSHELIRGCHGLIVGAKDSITTEFLDAAGETLLVVASNSVGFDHMLAGVEPALERGIALTHTPEVLTAAVAEQTFALMALYLRDPLSWHATVLEGSFFDRRSALLGDQGFEKTRLGVVGVGAIGSEVARRGAAFGMEILGNDIDPRRPGAFVERTLPLRMCSLDELLEQADVVSLHVDLNPTSYHLISTPQLERMKPSAGLINTSRGQVVDEPALATALERRNLAWAALDVFEHEPRIHPGLLKLAHETPAGRRGPLLLAPHVASGTRRARGAMAERAVSNLRRALVGDDPRSLDLIPPLLAKLTPGYLEALRDRQHRLHQRPI